MGFRKVIAPRPIEIGGSFPASRFFPTYASGSAFMVDHALQGQGIATQAVRALPGYLAKHYPDAPAIWLTVNKVNPAALRAYLKGGFEDTGDEWPHGDAGPQHILKLPLG